MSDEVVTTGGRRMSRSLERALDGFIGPDLKITRDLFREMAVYSTARDSDVTLNQLYAALAVEIDLVEQRENELFRNLAADHRGDLDELPQPPLPVAEGRAMVHLEHSGDWIPLDVFDTPPDETPPPNISA